MKVFISIFVLISVFANAQVPVMSTINGATAVCSSPSAPNTFSTSASNSPTSYSWSVVPSAGVVITNPSASATPISFPYSSGAYTIYCSATNSVGTSVTSASFQVSTLSSPTLSFSPYIQYSVNPTYICPGLTRTLVVNGADTYTWSTGAIGNIAIVSSTVLGIKSYTVIGTSSLTGCQTTNIYTLTIVQPPSFAAGIIAMGSPTQGTICIGQSINMSANCGEGSPFFIANSCSYSPPTGLSPIYITSNLYNVIASPTVTTIYTVTGNGFGCQISSLITINVISCLGENEINSDLFGLKIYPNPANSVINVEFLVFNNANYKIEILNTLGQVLLQSSINNVPLSISTSLNLNSVEGQHSSINIRELPIGMYQLKLSDGIKQKTIKFIKN